MVQLCEKVSCQVGELGLGDDRGDEMFCSWEDVSKRGGGEAMGRCQGGRRVVRATRFLGSAALRSE